jgi:hypothetical protein
MTTISNFKTHSDSIQPAISKGITQESSQDYQLQRPQAESKIPASAYKARFMPSFSSSDAPEIKIKKRLTENLKKLESLAESDETILRKICEYRPIIEKEHSGLLTSQLDTLIILVEVILELSEIAEDLPQELLNLTDEEAQRQFFDFAAQNPKKALALSFAIQNYTNIENAILAQPVLHGAALSEFLDTLE